MKFDALAWVEAAADVAGLAKAAEAAGIDRLRIPETKHEPFVLSALALAATRRLEVGTEVAIAFARSPTVVAHAAWDLAALGAGRFHLGLGSQVRAHIEWRYGMTWDAPIGRMREYVRALRGVWRSWQEGVPLDVEGRYYRLTLMTPFFNPGPIPWPAVPVGIAGVNPPWARLAGEVAQAFHVHPLHTAAYLREVLLPAVQTGVQRGGRRREEVEVAGSVFVITGRDEDEKASMRRAVREQVAFYASTPSYRRVLEYHGWGALRERLSQMARAGRWGEMGAVVPDEVLTEVAVEAAPDELAGRLVERYRGLLDRVALYLPFRPAPWGEWWARWAQAVRAGGA